MKKLASLVVCLTLCACGEPASKQNSSPNNGGTNNATNNSGSNNGGSNNSGSNNSGSNNSGSNNVNSTNNSTLGGTGDPCDDATPCEEGLRCQSAEERSWNFCGAPMEPDCAETEVGDSCGHCFLACSGDDDCDGQTCNGAYCIGPRTCAAESPPPP